ncbi:FkbM family methyltransferase [Eubacteriales bacterium OttesenSCG-928-G02]|nr:FkbM family methyltransferase [Eubacteriales bacterium OttesenSCG-928-G02]
MFIDNLLELKSFIEIIKENPKPVLIYGMGNGAEKIIKYLETNDIQITDIFASDEFVRGQCFLNYKVKTFKEAEKLYTDFYIVSAFALEGDKAELLFKISEKYKLFAPNLPPFDNACIDKKFIKNNIERLERLYNNLSDELSKNLFFDYLKYCITADVNYIKGEYDISPEKYFNHEFAHIDVGAYDGDSVCDYIKYNRKYSIIFAVEPDKNTYKKLKTNTTHIPRIEYVNSAAWKANGTMKLDSKNSRASSLNMEGNIYTSTVTIDTLCKQTTLNNNGYITGSIKIDGEGADKEILQGAVNVIYKYQPAMKISTYHKSEDILDIPEFMLYHNPKYKIYFRRKKYIPAFDTYLYFIP